MVEILYIQSQLRARNYDPVRPIPNESNTTQIHQVAAPVVQTSKASQTRHAQDKKRFSRCVISTPAQRQVFSFHLAALSTQKQVRHCEAFYTNGQSTSTKPACLPKKVVGLHCLIPGRESTHFGVGSAFIDRRPFECQ